MQFVEKMQIYSKKRILRERFLPLVNVDLRRSLVRNGFFVFSKFGEHEFRRQLFQGERTGLAIRLRIGPLQREQRSRLFREQNELVDDQISWKYRLDLITIPCQIQRHFVRKFKVPGLSVSEVEHGVNLLLLSEYFAARMTQENDVTIATCKDGHVGLRMLQVEAFGHCRRFVQEFSGGSLTLVDRCLHGGLHSILETLDSATKPIFTYSSCSKF